MPDHIVVYRNPKELKADPKNTRTHSDGQIEKLRRSIRAFKFNAPILLKGDGETIGAGHARALAAGLENLEQVPTITLSHLSDEEWRAYEIADNALALEGAGAGWDYKLLQIEIGELKALNFDITLLGFEPASLSNILSGLGPLPPGSGQGREGPPLGSLTDRFMIAPFSVFNAREGWWQNRKRLWIALGIQSELGRGLNALGFSETVNDKMRAKDERGKSLGRKANAEPAGGGGGAWQDPTLYKRKAAVEAQLGRTITLDEFREKYWTPPPADSFSKAGRAARATGTQEWVQQKIAEGDIEGGMAAGQSGTSIFDPVLCEIAYRWFSPPKGKTFDPFAGGSVRGIVAAKLGREYVGVDLRPEQAEANLAQAQKICPDNSPRWVVGDALEILRDHKGRYDFVFSCPPYGDLERYSDDPRDLSNMPRHEFIAAYRDIIAMSMVRLKEHRFACFVVGDYRDGDGFYNDFIGTTVEAFEAAGAKLYNEAILITAAGSLPIRAGKQFSTSRKLGKTHQNVLVFCKGDPRKATEACGPVEIGDDLFEGEETPFGEKLTAANLGGEM